VTPPFRHRIRVRFGECDPQGVVFYAHYLSYWDVAITELWRETVGPHTDMVGAGADLMVAEANIRYRASAKFDDEIDVLITITRLGTTSMTTAMSVERVPDGELLAEGELRHVFVHPKRLEKLQIPPEVRAALERYAVEAVA
jgi:acyl-CoA thioester hydrolase